MATLQQRRWYKKFCFFCKILKLNSPSYLHKSVLVPSRSYRTGNVIKFLYLALSIIFSEILFSLVNNEWNNLDNDITNSESITAFLKKISAFTRPTPNLTFNCINHKCLKLLTRLHLGWSHLRKHEFKHSFQNSFNLYCTCKNGNLETCCHIFLQCPNLSDERLALLSSLRNIGATML